MFKSKPKPTPPKRERKRDPNELGLFGLTDNLALDTNDDDISDGADSDLEAELAAITSGGGAKPARRPKPKVNPVADLDAMIAESLKDIPSDAELSGDDDEFMGELHELAGGDEEEEVEVKPQAAPVILPTTSSVDLLKGRIAMYTSAEAAATAAGDSGKARRFNRALKTLKDLLKQAEKGKAIDPSEIPPEVTVKAKEESDAPPPVPARQAPAPPSIPPPELPKEEPEDPRLSLLLKRKDEFKRAALEAKKSGDNATAIKHIKTVKQFDAVIEALKNGQNVDLSQMPTLEQKEVKRDAPAPPKEEKTEAEVQQDAAPEPAPDLITAGSIGEALEQHLEKFKEVEKAAKEEGNSSKARRIGRVIKQFEQTIKLHKAGKPIQIDDLPVPQGYAPIPVPKAAPVPATAPQKPPAATVSPKPVPASPSTSTKSTPEPKEQTRVSGNAKNTTLMDRQVAFLLGRQREFRQAAIEAKKSGEVEQAKEYLRIFKGMETLVEAARGGFPVDMATVPIPPSQRSALEDGFTFVSTAEVAEEANDTIDIRVRLEEQLSKQLMMCRNIRDHHKLMGDVPGTNRFENLALGVQQDLDFVRLAHRQGLAIPKFHYENRTYNLVKCNTEVSDNEVEIHVVRGISYIVPNPRDVDTYVKVEFPWPQEEPYKTKTSVVKNTDCPEYNQKFLVEIQRNSKACTRIFKRQQIKLEVYSKGGFLRSDTLIGTVLIKIQPLETTCDIHDSFPIMDGRRPNGGKLEVKIRVRNPILTKQMEQINERWVVMDS